MDPTSLGFTDYQAALSAALTTIPETAFDAVVQALTDAWGIDAVFTAGNGGSAATASHMACDFNKTTLGKTLPLPAKRLSTICLNDSMAQITAWANDTSYEVALAEQLRTLAEKGDVLIVISASGNSPNILAALKAAEELEMLSIGLLGFDGGAAAALCDHTLIVRCDHYGVIEDCHSILMHMLTDALKSVVPS